MGGRLQFLLVLSRYPVEAPANLAKNRNNHSDS